MAPGALVTYIQPFFPHRFSYLAHYTLCGILLGRYCKVGRGVFGVERPLILLCRS